MKLLVGLGNPGADYARHRHNIGFMAVDAIARRHGFSPWRPKFQGLAAEGALAGEKVLLLKPQTYMNESGRSVQAAASFHKIAPADITVLHDELDLAPSKVRIKTGGGHAGHNGLRSIHAHLGPDFRRVRLGIGHPGAKDLVTPWVLGNFAKADEEDLARLLDAIAEAADALVAGRDTDFMNHIARAAQPAAGETVAPAPKSAAAPAAPTQTSKNAMADALRRLLAAKLPGGRKGPR